MKATAILFDLDGTLVDTLEDIAASANHVLAAHGLPERALSEFPPWVGEGVTQLVVRAAALPLAEDAAELVRDFRAHYADHMLDRSRPYPGIEALLAELARRGVPMGVLSNKPHPATAHIVASLFRGIPFLEVLGHRTELPPKPDPTSARLVAQRMGVAPEAFLFVGDTAVDIATGRAAGMRPVGVGWGFRGPELLRREGAIAILESPAELLSML